MTLIDDLRRRASFLTTKEIMALLQLGRNTACEWSKTGRLPAILTPGGYRYDPAELADWLEARSTGTKGKVAA